MEPPLLELPLPLWHALPGLLARDGFELALVKAPGPIALRCSGQQHVIELWSLLADSAVLSVDNLRNREVAARIERMLIASGASASVPEALSIGTGLLMRGAPAVVAAFIDASLVPLGRLVERRGALCGGSASFRFGTIAAVSGPIRFETGPCIDPASHADAEFICIEPHFGTTQRNDRTALLDTLRRHADELGLHCLAPLARNPR